MGAPGLWRSYFRMARIAKTSAATVTQKELNYMLKSALIDKYQLCKVIEPVAILPAKSTQKTSQTRRDFQVQVTVTMSTVLTER